MSDIPPIARPPSSAQAEPEESRFFEEAMATPLKILAAMEGGQALKLTEPHRFEVAKLCIQKDPRDTVKKIHCFVLGQGNRQLIAKLCLENNIDALIENIDNFKLTPAQLFLIVKLCLEKNMDAVIENIDKFGLNPSQRSYVIKLCLQKDIGTLDKFALSYEQRLDAAKFCAEKNINTFIQNIDKFALTEDQLFEIVKPYVQKGILTITQINQLNLPNNLFTEILVEAIRASPRVLHSILDEEGDTIHQCLSILFRTGWIDEHKWIKLIKNRSPEEQKIVLTRALDAVSLICTSPPITQRQILWLSEQMWLEKILGSQAPTYLDSSLINLFKEIANEPLHFEKLSATFPPLLSLPLAKLRSQGVNVDGLELNQKDLKDKKKFTTFLHCMIQLAEDDLLSSKEKTQIFEALTKETVTLSKEINFLREKMTVLTKKASNLKGEMATLHQQIAAMSPQDASALRKKQLIELQNLKVSYRKAKDKVPGLVSDLSTILNCQRKDFLQGDGIQGTEDLKTAAAQAFQAILVLPAPVDNFSMDYQRTFGAYRQPNALQIYASGLNKDPLYRPALESLGSHVFSIFKGTYTKDRYDPTKNPHLQRLEQYDPKLLRDWQKNFNEPLKDFPEFSIHETDDAEDILLCGTEIADSCQHIQYGPSKNQGLVGYLRNGQTRLLAIKDEEGHLVARRMLRLLWDDRTEKPVLFLEIPYSNVDNPAFDRALIERAKQTASKLGCLLTTIKLPPEDYKDYPHPLQSLGGAAPCEYVDGAGGLKEGPYTIHVAQLMYDPASAAAM